MFFFETTHWAFCIQNSVALLKCNAMPRRVCCKIAFYFPSFFSFERVGKSLNIIERFEVIACAWLRDWAIWFGAIKVGKRSSFDMPRNYNFWAPKWWHTQWSLDLRTKKCFCCSFHTNFLSSSRKGQPCREILRVNSKFECIFFQPPPFSHLYQEVHHQLNLTA